MTKQWSPQATREMMSEVRKIMNLPSKGGKLQLGRKFQDFFGYQDIYSDATAREWLENPRNLLLAELYVAELLAR